MVHLETDISYLLGRYIGQGRAIEKELDRLTKKESPSAIEDYLDEFLENPAGALRQCQEAIIKEQIVLKRVDKTDLIDESNEILKMIKVDVLEHITIDAANFLHGYHKQLEQHNFL